MDVPYSAVQCGSLSRLEGKRRDRTRRLSPSGRCTVGCAVQGSAYCYSWQRLALLIIIIKRMNGCFARLGLSTVDVQCSAGGSF